MPPVAATTKALKEKHKLEKEEVKKWKKKNTIKKLKKAAQAEEAVAPTAEAKPEKTEVSTLSIAVPGSILDNAQSSELRTYLVGQIARAACMFQVDEIVVFDDCNFTDKKKNIYEDGTEVRAVSRACKQMVRILQYLECPQYLRKFLFPIHDDLKYAGILNPVEAPHHLRTQNTFEFREGIVTNKPNKVGRGSKVNVGLLQDVEIDKILTAGFRCTVKIDSETMNTKKLKGKVVSPSQPRLETGVYWGYTVRLANSFAEIFSKSPFKDGYDMSIGTSDRGDSIDTFSCPKFKHLLVVFGGLHGIEAALEVEEKLCVEDPRLLFDHYLNTLPSQGSRTVRTEEAILVTLTGLRPKLNPENAPVEFTQHEAIACSAEAF